MLRGEWFAQVVRFAARRSTAVLAVLALLVLGAVALATRLEPSSSTDTLVGKGTATYKATQRFKKEFGDEAVIVLIKGNVSKVALSQRTAPGGGHTTDLVERLLPLEGCLSGNVPKTGPVPGVLSTLPKPCQELARLKPVKVVYGPATFLNEAVRQIEVRFVALQKQYQSQAAQARTAAIALSKRRGDPPAEQKRLGDSAAQIALGQLSQQLISFGVRYGFSSLPSIADPQFVSAVIFDSTKPSGTPKARFAYLFPSPDAGLIQIRLKPGLTDAQHEHAIELIKQAVADPRFKPENAQLIVSGVPVVAAALANSVKRSIFVLLGAALLVMAATLALVFRTRLRLLPLVLALSAAALTYGALALVGGTLTMASIAVLPVLIGLAVDYAIQFQARFDEQRRRGLPASEAGPAAAAAGGPTIATAGLATGAGFLVLLLSPVPMVRDFGAMLVIGIVLAFGCAITVGFALLVRFGEPRERPADAPPFAPRLRRRIALAGAWVRTGPIGSAVTRAARAAFGLSLRRPGAVLAGATVVAVVGIVLSLFHQVESDVRKLVPQDLPALRDANQLQKSTGVSGEIDVTVRAPGHLTDPATIDWMTRFQERVLARHGYPVGSKKTCQQPHDPPELCPAFSLPDLFRSGAGSTGNVKALLDAIPPYFSGAVVARDPVTKQPTTANLAFGIRLMPLDRQEKVVQDIKDAIGDPKLGRPKGVSATVAGLPVLAAEANAKLSSPWWRLGTLLGSLLLVFFVLWLLSGRRVRAAAVPLVPVALAAGWSGAILFVLQIPLNPMSVTLGSLVIAIATEFSVLLNARYRQERATGVDPVVALERAYASTGAAVVASGVTAIAGFAVLIASDISMLRQFGISTVIDLTVSLLGVLFVLPATLLWAEDHAPTRLSDIDPRELVAAAGRGLRGTPGAVRGASRGLRRGRRALARFSLPSLRRRA